MFFCCWLCKVLVLVVMMNWFLGCLIFILMLVKFCWCRVIMVLVRLFCCGYWLGCCVLIVVRCRLMVVWLVIRNGCSMWCILVICLYLSWIWICWRICIFCVVCMVVVCVRCLVMCWLLLVLLVMRIFWFVSFWLVRSVVWYWFGFGCCWFCCGCLMSFMLILIWMVLIW